MGGAANPITGVQDLPGVSGVDGLAPEVDVIRHQDTLLTSAQIKALRATNIEVVRAPASGWAAVPVGIHMFLDHGGTDYVQTAGADHLALLYNGGSEIAEIGLEATLTTFLEASADAGLTVIFGEATAVGGIVPVAATPIDLDLNGGNELTTGNGLLSIRSYYKLVPMFRFS